MEYDDEQVTAMFLVRHPPAAFILIISACLFLWSGEVCSAQQSSARWFELLTMNGGKPNLSETGEGITSYKITELYQRGTTSITLIKELHPRLKLELPIGYTVFNNLIYAVDTKAVFTGPTDITFKLPSVRTKETFDQLRILYAQYDNADPEVPKWIDATVGDDNLVRLRREFSESESKQRLRNFDTRTLHAFTEEDEPLVIIVALWDPAKVRDKFTADVGISGTGTSTVTEGKLVTYDLKVTNNGPDTATGIALHAYPGFTFVSVVASQGTCRMSGQNVYCKFPSLEKDHAIDVKIVYRCPWGHPEGPTSYEDSALSLYKPIWVTATEQDPFRENNELRFTTKVFPDSNKGPVIEVVSPASPLFQGPAATVPIRVKASDPDGFIKKVEVFVEETRSLGEATLRSAGEYELLYKDVPFGNHFVTIVATDNLGRFETVKTMNFFVNGLAKVEITNPKAGSKLNKADGEFTVTIHATSPTTPLKKVSLGFWDSDATPVGNDDYVVKMKNCLRLCQVQAIAIDEKGVKTLSEVVEFTVLNPPATTLSWIDGESPRDFDTSKPMKVRELVLIGRGEREESFGADVKKVEIFANGELLCSDDSPMFGASGECLWRPRPGKYKLQAVATDADGGVGKSAVIEVVIESP